MTGIMDTGTVVELTADFPFLRLLSFLELQIFQKVQFYLVQVAFNKKYVHIL